MRRAALSWLAVGVGLLFGFFALARFGMAWPPSNDDLAASLDRIRRWCASGAGIPCRLHRRVTESQASGNHLPDLHAGYSFLSRISVFGISGLAFRVAVGSKCPEIPTAIGLTAIFFLAIFATLLAIRYRRRAVKLFGATVALTAFVFGLSHWTKAFLPPFGGWSALFLLFGLFWRGTGNRGWPSLLQPRSRPLSQRAAAFVFTCIVVFCVDVVATLGFSALGSSLFSGDCRGKPLFVHPESPYHAVFTARVIFVGRSIEALTRDRGILRDPQIPGSRDPRVGDWAVGVVQERFWGLPLWSRLVLLKNLIYWDDQTYFVDGSRDRGLLSRVLPIVDGRTNCSRTKPAQDALVDLRALREPPSATGTRLLGYVREPETFVGGLAPPPQSKVCRRCED